MNTIIFNTYQNLCKHVGQEILTDLSHNPQQMLCIAAGHTSLGVFEYLVKAFLENKADFSKAWFVAMDEWLHMDANTEGSCGYFLREHFLSKVNYPSSHIRLWDGKALNEKEECKDIEDFILNNSSNHRINYLVLGSGINGHLAFNEPGTPFHSQAHVAILDPITCQTGQKYFSKKTELSAGITLGITDFKRADRTVLIINGKTKHEITKKIMCAKTPDINIPATALLTFHNASLYCDRDAAGK